MGCGASASVDQHSPTLLIVGGSETGKIDEQSSKIEAYVLQGCVHQASYSLPKRDENEASPVLSHGYDVTCHPKKPMLFVTGGCYGDSDEKCNHFWSIELTKCGSDTQKGPNLPAMIKHHKTCYVIHEDEEYLFLVGNGNWFVRYNYQEGKWEELTSLPQQLDKFDSLIYIDGSIYCVGDGQLLSYSVDSGTDGNWRILISDRSFPLGPVCTVNGKLYAYSLKDNAVFEYELGSGLLTKFCDVDPKDIRGRGGMVAFGDSTNAYIYFTGEHDKKVANDENKVVELDLDKNRAAVAGYIKTKNEGHIALLTMHL